LQKALKAINEHVLIFNPNPSEVIMKKFRFYVAISLAILIVLTVCFLYFFDYLEREKPAIKLNQEFTAIGKLKNVGITFLDQKSGISNMIFEIVQDNKSHILVNENISSRGTKQKILFVSIDTTLLNLHDGPATVNITATDYSIFRNQTIQSLTVTIDTIPPQITLLSTINNVNQGGTCFISYRTSKPTDLTGVYVNDYFTAGYTLMMNNKPTSVTYFALPYNASRTKTKIAVLARDYAGNETRIPLPFIIREKKFRSDKMNLSETFLDQKMPEFQAMVPALQGKTPLEIFNYVNSEMRNDNFQSIQSICQKSTPKILWEGTFLRMRRASPMALFGDIRSYVVAGKDFANSLHVGVDLASVAHAAIEAANNGIVVFAGPLGIYGNTIIIDHGLGIFSLYGHLSSIVTAVGKTVKKEEVIGYSGTSGLAGGDHLHFSIIVGGQFVNPQEWWDAHWIEDNINKKSRL
jgi:murein DD-endopeptidase MepM/ murein hydrolase activator NlpD